MFFVLSKVFSFLISPFSWLTILLALIMIFRKKKWRKKLIIAFVVIFLFFSNSFIVDEAYRLWEIPTVKNNTLDTYDIGIVLCGMATYDNENERLNFHPGVDRLLQALQLYYEGKVKKILLAGGSGSLTDQKNKEAEFLKTYLLKTGFPQSDLIIEPESRNTYENACNSAKLLKERGGEEKLLLITSAYHMRRSKQCFRKQGLNADTYTTNRVAGPRKFIPDHLFVPNAGAINAWGALLHELVGYVVYWIKDYI